MELAIYSHKIIEEVNHGWNCHLTSVTSPPFY